MKELTLDLREQAALVWRWAWLIALVAVGFALMGFAWSSIQPKVYQSQATLAVGQSLSAVSPEYNELLASQVLSQTYVAVATTAPLLQRVATAEGDALSAEDLRSRVVAVAPRDSSLITVTVSDGQADRAARLANEVAAELMALSPTLQGANGDVQQFTDQQIADIQTEITATQAAIDALPAQPSMAPGESQYLQFLENRLASLRLAFRNLLEMSASQSANLLTIIEPATPPSEAAAPRIRVDTLIAAGVGVLFALLLIFGREYLDDTIRNGSDAETATGAVVYGSIPPVSGPQATRAMPTVNAPRSTSAEAFRTLRTNIQSGLSDLSPPSTLITSSVANEGKTLVAANLAVAFAQLEHQTLLIDANLRNPQIHHLFGLNNEEGLMSMIASEPDPSRYIQETSVRGLKVLTSGPLAGNPSDVLGSRRFARLLAYLDELADAMIIDGPHVTGLADASILASLVDRSLVVVRVGRTRRSVAAAAIEALSRVGDRPVGLVLNGLPGRYARDSYARRDTQAPAPAGREQGKV